MNSEEPQSPSFADASLPVRLLRNVLAATGLIALIEDADLVTLHGLLERWISTYTDVVDKLHSGLLAWIHLSWIQITQGETYILSLSLLLNSAWARASYRHDRKQNRDRFESVGRAFGLTLFYSGVSLVVLVLVPAPGSVIAALIWTVIVTAMLVTSTEDADNPSGATNRLELLTIGSLTLLALVVNSWLLT